MLQHRMGNTAHLEEKPGLDPRQATELNDYKFPVHRLQHTLKDPNKIPLVIVACGSFSPITYLHLRIFEMAVDDIRERTSFEVVGGYYSPVSDSYSKPGLEKAVHRVRMCELATERTSSWLMVDAWESLQPNYTRTARVLDHFDRELNRSTDAQAAAQKGKLISAPDGSPRTCKIMLLAGSDLIISTKDPEVWSAVDLDHIFKKYGALIVERTGSDVWQFLISHDILWQHRRNIMVIKQLIYNDISSTKVRLFLRRGMSVQYLLPNSVIKYIEDNDLFMSPEPVNSIL